MRPRPDHGETSDVGSGRLAGRKALITGGDSGIGRAAAIAFAREGADVAIGYLPFEEEDAQEVVELIREAGRVAVAVAGDISGEAECRRVVSNAVDGLGGLDILVDYAASKAAIVSLTQSLSKQLAPKGIRVNAVAPGPYWTPLQVCGGQDPEKLPTFGAEARMGRPGQPAEIAVLYVLLASGESSYTSGDIFGSTGGKPQGRAAAPEEVRLRRRRQQRYSFISNEGIHMYVTTTDKTELYVKDWGTGPAVILIHGWPLSANSWDEQAMALADAGMRVISYDRRGFGRSSQPWSGYDYDTLADDLAAVKEQCGAPEAALVGFSMGGGEVARCMSRHGGKGVSKAVLMSSVVPYMLKTPDNPDGTPKSI